MATPTTPAALGWRPIFLDTATREVGAYVDAGGRLIGVVKTPVRKMSGRGGFPSTWIEYEKTYTVIGRRTGRVLAEFARFGRASEAARGLDDAIATFRTTIDLADVEGIAADHLGPVVKP
jgi:hypothetical protein